MMVFAGGVSSATYVIRVAANVSSGSCISEAAPLHVEHRKYPWRRMAADGSSSGALEEFEGKKSL